MRRCTMPIGPVSQPLSQVHGEQERGASVTSILGGLFALAALLCGWCWGRHRYLRRQMAPLERTVDAGSADWQHDWLSVASRMSGTAGGRDVAVSAEVGNVFSVSVETGCATGMEAIVGRFTMAGWLARFSNRGRPFRLPEVGRCWVAGPDADALHQVLEEESDLRSRVQQLFTGPRPTFLVIEPDRVVARYHRTAKRLLEPAVTRLSLSALANLATAVESMPGKGS